MAEHVATDLLKSKLTALESEHDAVAMELWNLAEVSLQEVKSAASLIDRLEAQGFAITSRGTSGIPTAFIAEWSQGSGGPVLGILLEYDALPGLGNAAVAAKCAREDGHEHGHGCGHNLIGSAAYTASVALKDAMAQTGTAGTLRVYGCASEETEGAKVYMARDNLFADLDACLHSHPLDRAMVGNVRTSATDNMRVEFFGTTAHAGNSPWLGRSAVDACELFAHGLNLMREHIEPTARLHYVYESAGTAPNVVPDYARMWVTSRDIDRAHVMKTSEWIKQIAEGAALATQTKAKVELYYGMADLVPNAPLAQRMQAILEKIGAPVWSDEDQAFARELQKAFGVPEKGLVTDVSPLPPEPALGGSTDVGDVSYLTPTMGLSMPTLPIGISLHTWAATASHGMQIGLKAGRQTALALALLGWEILTDADLRTAARADLERRTADNPYRSALPADRKIPFDMPKWMIPTDGSREMMQ